MTPTRSILRGDLGTIGLATLLTLLEMERRGGLLVLQRGKRLGRLFVSDEGRVLRAQIEGGRRQSGVEAVYELLCWEDGQFELWQANIAMDDEVRASTTFLLMEAARIRDEREAEAAGMASLTGGTSGALARA